MWKLKVLKEGRLPTNAVSFCVENSWSLPLLSFVQDLEDLFQRRQPSKGSRGAVVVCTTDLFIAGKAVTGLSWGVSPQTLIVRSSEMALTFWYSEISLSRTFCPCMMGLGLF